MTHLSKGSVSKERKESGVPAHAREGVECCPCHGEPWYVSRGRRWCRVQRREIKRAWRAANPEKHGEAVRRNRERRKARENGVG